MEILFTFLFESEVGSGDEFGLAVIPLDLESLGVSAVLYNIASLPCKRSVIVEIFRKRPDLTLRISMFF